jgi:hypothetical protein
MRDIETAPDGSRTVQCTSDVQSRHNAIKTRSRETVILGGQTNADRGFNQVLWCCRQTVNDDV